MENTKEHPMTATTMTLTEFLRARLDDDEAAARECIDDDPHWVVTPEGLDQYGVNPDGTVTSSGYFVQVRRPMANAHIARHDPARVLAEVEAKRRIVDECQQMWECDPYGIDSDEREHGDSILALLALPYADHPDYRPEWRP